MAGKNWIQGGPGPLVFHIVVNYCCKRKMLKRNWNWRNNRLFWHIFVIGEISIGEGQVPWSPPWDTPKLQLRKTKKVLANFPRGFWRFPTKFQRFKRLLSSSRGQANFRGLEASRPRPRTWPSRPRQGQWLQNVSSRSRTSSRTPPLPGRMITISCPGHPDLTPCNFFLWGFVKRLVFVPPILRDVGELKAQITKAVATIHNAKLGKNLTIGLMGVWRMMRPLVSQWHCCVIMFVCA